MPLIQYMSGALGSCVALACAAWAFCQGLGLEGFHSSDRLSSLPHQLPPQSSGINPGKWEGLLPPCCYSFPGVQIPGQPRIRRLHCQSVRKKKKNKWQQIKRTGGVWSEVRWGARERWEVGKEKETRWNERKRLRTGRETRERALGMWTMLKPFNSNQHHVSSRALLSHKWTLLRQQSALELCKNIKGASPVSAWSQEESGSSRDLWKKRGLGLMFAALSIASQAGWYCRVMAY